MPGFNGRDLLIQIDDVTIAAVTAKTITRTREPVDITSDDSNGFRTLLAEPGLRTIDISIEGVATSANYSAWLVRYENNVLEDVSLVSPDGAVERGNFFLSSLVNGGEHADKVTFSATLQSSGLITSSEAS